MIRQSHPPVILLTRPEAQSRRFATELLQGLGPLPVMISPLMAVEYLPAAISDRHYSACVLTSETGVKAAAQREDRASLPTKALCVGKRTADAALANGFEPLVVTQTSAALIAWCLAVGPTPPLLILRGEDSAGEIDKVLGSAGIETVSAVIYRQAARPLTEEAVSLLRSGAEVVLPLFSARSAGLFAAEAARIRSIAPLYLAALSPAVIEASAAIAAQARQIAAYPDSAAMITAISALIAAGGAA